MSISSESGSKGHWREGVPVQGDSGAFVVGVRKTVLAALVLYVSVTCCESLFSKKFFESHSYTLHTACHKD